MLTLPRDLTQAEASDCLHQLVQGLSQQPGTDVVVDAAALGRFDSAALAVLLALRRECAALNKKLLLRGAPARLLDLAKLYGISGLLPSVAV